MDALKAAKMRVRANPVNSPGCLTFAVNGGREENQFCGLGAVPSKFFSQDFFLRDAK